ncbi:hypothetical protein PGB90_010405 [Kerria lacca]
MSHGQKMVELIRGKEKLIGSCNKHPTRHNNVRIGYDEELYDSDLGVDYLPLSPNFVPSTCGSPMPSGLVTPPENHASKSGVSSVQENDLLLTNATELLEVNQFSADSHSNADNRSVVFLETDAMECCHSRSSSTSSKRNQFAVALETNVPESPSRSSSMFSSCSNISTSSDSSSSSSSSSEDCDDLLNDQTYEPKLSEEDNEDNEDEQITSPIPKINQNTSNHSTSTVFSPQLHSTLIDGTVASTSSSTQDTEIFKASNHIVVVMVPLRGRVAVATPEDITYIWFTIIVQNESSIIATGWIRGSSARPEDPSENNQSYFEVQHGFYFRMLSSYSNSKDTKLLRGKKKEVRTDDRL